MINASTQRRGAFDIGSGATKLQISDVTAGGKIVQTWFGEERPCSFGADCLKSKDGLLSATIQEKGIQTIIDLKLIGDEYGVEKYAVIATEVFRKANNGHEFLSKVRSMGLPVTVVSQELEAELGYATALASTINGDRCIAWDSGGGSFQISTVVNSGESSSDLSSDDIGKLSMYMGTIGSSVATATLIKLQSGGAERTSPNPVSIEEVHLLIETLKNKMEHVPTWLFNASEVIAIGGPNSIFQLACKILSVLKGSAGSDAVNSFTIADINTAINECVNKSDDYLMKFVDFPLADPVSIIGMWLNKYNDIIHADITHFQFSFL
jgi:hypothetical protein